jgi:hypothetical protein
MTVAFRMGIYLLAVMKKKEPVRLLFFEIKRKGDVAEGGVKLC